LGITVVTRRPHISGLRLRVVCGWQEYEVRELLAQCEASELDLQQQQQQHLPTIPSLVPPPISVAGPAADMPTGRRSKVGRLLFGKQVVKEFRLKAASQGRAATPTPEKNSPFLEGIRAPSNTWFLGSCRVHTPKRHFDLFSRFGTTHGCSVTGASSLSYRGPTIDVKNVFAFFLFWSRFFTFFNGFPKRFLLLKKRWQSSERQAD